MLAEALAAAAERWPPGRVDPHVAAQVRQIRADAEIRQLERWELPLAHGTVIVEPGKLEPSPGLRLVRVYPLADLARLPALLEPWAGRLQGAALSGPEAWGLEPALAGLGVSRCAEPGELQAVDASWSNGGIFPLEVFATSR